MTSERGTTEIVRFDGVSKDFVTPGRTIAAVRDIRLTVYAGEFVTLVGPSGCGKSTLLNMTAGVFAPTSGTVFYRGLPVAGYNHQVGYMTQNDHLLPWRDVVGNIAVPLDLQKMPRSERNDRVNALIEMVGLRGFGKSYPAQLSGGMRKRTALARLLAYDPETLLMDEPFAALDAQLRLRMQIELRELCRKLSKTVMFVTHDLDEAVALADRCAIFSPRPGAIRRIIDVDLPKDRDLTKLRRRTDYNNLTAELWDEIAPTLGTQEGELAP